MRFPDLRALSSAQDELFFSISGAKWLSQILIYEEKERKQKHNGKME